MPTVEKTSGGRVYIRSLDQRFAVGDRVDVDEEMAAYLCDERGDFGRVVEKTEAEDESEDVGVAPFDPGEYTVDELRSELDDGDYGGSELHALAAAEEDGENRETAIDAIEAHIPDDEEEA